MNGLSWSSLVRGLAWTFAIAIFVSTVLSILLGLEVFGSPPERGDDFIQFVLELFRWDSSLWPIDFAATALFAIASLALAGLGPALRRLASPGDGRRGLIGTSFLSAGLVAAISSLIWIGAHPIATDPEYCDCGFLQEEIMARLMINDVVAGVRNWLLNGFLLLLVVGLVAMARLGQQKGMPNGWRLLSVVIAVLSLALVAMSFFYAFPFDVVAVALIGGVLAPWWALWLARRADILWPESERPPMASISPD